MVVSNSSETPESIAPRKSRIVVIKNIPLGLWEPQLIQFFSQVAEVKNCRILRSPKTGKSRGLAYLEFTDADVAKVVIDEMDCYALGDKIIRVTPFAKDKVVRLFSKGRDDTLRVKSNENLKVAKQHKMMSAFNNKKIKKASYTEEAVVKATATFNKNLKKKNAKLSKAGINYKF